jgi:hypothetical protein
MFEMHAGMLVPHKLKPCFAPSPPVRYAPADFLAVAPCCIPLGFKVLIAD